MGPICKTFILDTIIGRYSIHIECPLLDSLLETLLNLWMWQWIWQWIQQTTDSYIILSKLLALKCQKQKHSKNIVLLWPCGDKDQSFLAFWYKSKQDILIQRSKNTDEKR